MKLLSIPLLILASIPLQAEVEEFFEKKIRPVLAERCHSCHSRQAEALKSELGERFGSHGEAKMELFDYIEVFYNQRRRHSTIGQISPAEYERQSQVA